MYDEDATESDDSSKGEEQADLPGNNGESETVKKTTGNVDSTNEKQMKNSVALKELVVRGMVKKKAWQTVQASRIAGTTDERCREALSHIRKVLKMLFGLFVFLHTVFMYSKFFFLQRDNSIWSDQ